MENYYYKQNSSFCFFLSLVFHSFLLFLLFASLVSLTPPDFLLNKQPLETEQEQQKQPSAPILFYSEPEKKVTKERKQEKLNPGTTPQEVEAQTLLPPSFGSSASQERFQPALHNGNFAAQVNEIAENTPENTVLSANVTEQETVASTVENDTTTSSKDTENTHEELARSEKNSIASEIPTLGLFSAQPAQHTKKSEKTAYSDQKSGDVRKRRLTLADLFTTMPHTNPEGSSQEGNGTAGNQLVITQGDIRHYSFLQKFIGHINDSFTFYGGPKKLSAWAQKGAIKRNAGLAVSIDRKGNVLKIELLNSSGHPEVDAILLEGIKIASPFPPVPENITHEKVRVELISVTS